MRCRQRHFSGGSPDRSALSGWGWAPTSAATERRILMQTTTSVDLLLLLALLLLADCNRLDQQATREGEPQVSPPPSWRRCHRGMWRRSLHCATCCESGAAWRPAYRSHAQGQKSPVVQQISLSAVQLHTRRTRGSNQLCRKQRGQTQAAAETRCRSHRLHELRSKDGARSSGGRGNGVGSTAAGLLRLQGYEWFQNDALVDGAGAGAGPRARARGGGAPYCTVDCQACVHAMRRQKRPKRHILRGSMRLGEARPDDS